MSVVIETEANLKQKEAINIENRARLKNTDFSIIASNCNGGIISHDLGLQFRSPFINLWLKPKEYIKLLQNLKEYMQYELTFIKEDGIDYPIGLLKDVRIYFMHYETEEIAKEKWEARAKRLNYDNLFILFTDRDECSLEDMEAFDNLPYKNKVIFVNKERPNIKSSYYIKGFENEESVGKLGIYIDEKSGKRYLDLFDYVEWFNNGNL